MLDSVFISDFLNRFRVIKQERSIKSADLATPLIDVMAMIECKFKILSSVSVYNFLVVSHAPVTALQNKSEIAFGM